MSAPGPGNRKKNKRKPKGRGDRGRGRGSAQEQLPTPGRSEAAAKPPDEEEGLDEEEPQGASCSPVPKEFKASPDPVQTSSPLEEKPVLAEPSRSSKSKKRVPTEEKPETNTQRFAEELGLEKAGPSQTASKTQTPSATGKGKQQLKPSQLEKPPTSPPPVTVKGISKDF